MISLKNKSKGFTLVELLIVIVIIAILATIVLVTYTGAQKKARDSKRQSDLVAINNTLQQFYTAGDGTQSNYYPTLTQLSDTAAGGWVATNLKGFDPNALKDPGGNAIAATASAKNYGYVVTPTGCDNTTTMCTNFVITADLEGGGTFVKQSTN